MALLVRLPQSDHGWHCVRWLPHADGVPYYKGYDLIQSWVTPGGKTVLLHPPSGSRHSCIFNCNLLTNIRSSDATVWLFMTTGMILPNVVVAALSALVLSLNGLRTDCTCTIMCCCILLHGASAPISLTLARSSYPASGGAEVH